MTKYKNFHYDKPEPNTPVYFICPTGKEVLGLFKGKTWFEDMDGKYKNFTAKLWRNLDDSELRLVQMIDVPEERPKRKYVRKNK